ncbi:MAG: hypothetical protein HOP11_09800 [Saprospiraceae bacterium]|nr:hypothetical protein [Saprospiraceae bacterium]
MTDLHVQNKDTHQRHNRKTSNAKVDFTAMVDLGFLLITFFMLATNFSLDNKMMTIVKPVDDSTFVGSSISVSRTISLLIGPNNKLYYYSLPDKITDYSNIVYDSTDYSSQGLRQVIMNRQKLLKKKYGTTDSLYIMIKPLPNCRYVNFVNILDEIAITQIKGYCIVKPDEEVDRYIINALNL